jgi:hypothetical protein
LPAERWIPRSFRRCLKSATILTIVLLAVGLLSLIQYFDRRLTPWRAPAT